MGLTGTLLDSWVSTGFIIIITDVNDLSERLRVSALINTI